MPGHGERYNRELRRFGLARRMIALNARTRTICIWTGLSEQKVQEAARCYWTGRGVSLRGRPSGPSPSALKIFWQSQRLRREALAIAGLALLLEVLPADGAALDVRRFPDLPRGERLCLAYETYLTFVPEPQISLEQAILLITALACGQQVVLGRCAECRGAMLIDRTDSSRPRCASCKR